MVLTSVDLPAPLSPTSATTSPARTSSSMSFSACTAPNLLDTPVMDRTVSVAAGEVVVVMVPSSAQARGGTGLGEVARADGGDRVDAVLDDGVLDVGLGHGHRREQRGRDVLVGGLRLRLLAVGQRHRRVGGVGGLGLDRLVDGHGLVTGGSGLTPPPLRAAMAPPAVPSLAA